MKLALIFSTMSLLLISSLNAQNATIKVWPDGVPGAKTDPNHSEETTMDRGSPRITKVTDPTLLVYLPPAQKANGTAVVVCPGGGYRVLAIDHEGYQIASWFNEMGVAAFILKYRLPSDAIMADKSIGPLQDAQEAVRIVRRRASEWRIDPNRIGIMGFSAGGHLASTASTHYLDAVYQPKDQTSARPDFSILIYPVVSFEQAYTHGGSKANLLGPSPSAEMVASYSNEKRVTKDTPPAFLVHSADDTAVPVANSILYFQALQNAGVQGELHVYQKGGHGYGLAKDRETESGWPEACRKWLQARGLIK